MSRAAGDGAQARICVLIAEDEAPLRAALADLIAGDESFELVGTAADADEAIELARTRLPDVALLDVRMPGGGGSRAVREIQAVSPATRSIAFSAYEDRSNVLEMLRSGAVSYLVKGVAAEEVLESVRRAARGQSSLSAAIIADLVGDGSRATTAAIAQQSEQQLEAILESAPDGVLIVDAAARVVFVNRHTESLFGYDRTELLDRPIEILLPEPLRGRNPTHGDSGLSALRTRSMGDGLPLAGRRKDGTEFPIDISLSEIETSDGRLAAVFVRDVTEREARAERGRAVLAHLVSAGEDERRRIAADIHDDSIQVMTAAGMRLQILRRSLDDPLALNLLSELEQTVQLAISRLRHLLFELHPPALDHDGLGPALRMYLDFADDDTTTAYHLDDRLTSQPSEVTRVILYRIAQEALTNARTHAFADNVTVTLAARDGGYYVRVVDDGVGFVPEGAVSRPGHLGIASIRERAELAGGWLRVESAPACGTTVEVWIAQGVESEAVENATVRVLEPNERA